MSKPKSAYMYTGKNRAACEAGMCCSVSVKAVVVTERSQLLVQTWKHPHDAEGYKGE